MNFKEVRKNNLDNLISWRVLYPKVQGSRSLRFLKGKRVSPFSSDIQYSLIQSYKVGNSTRVCTDQEIVKQPKGKVTSQPYSVRSIKLNSFFLPFLIRNNEAHSINIPFPIFQTPSLIKQT